MYSSKDRERALENPSGERGIALMMVLWVLMLLSIIVFEFCYTMRIEATIARNFRDGERSYYFAQAGIHRAIVEVIKAKSATKKFKGSKETLVKEKYRKESESEETGEEREEWKPAPLPYHFSFEDGECEVSIADEGSKINLNWIARQAKNNRTVLVDVLERGCGLEGEERDIIVDSIIDWVDKDHDHMFNGAEDEYYRSLEDPYECRDGDFVVTEELLLVRGVTEELYYGMSSSEKDVEIREASDYWSIMEEIKGKTRGLSELFTVFSDSTSLKVNLNDAPYGLLMVIPGMTSEVALHIMESRKEEAFEDINDIRLKELPNYAQIAPYLTVEPSNIYRIRARGRLMDSAVARSITAVVRFTPQQKTKYEIVYWQEGV